MKIVSVLRTGPEYQAEHAQLLHRQLPRNAVCLTNLPAIEGVDTLPLANDDWHGWWAKMELFNPNGPLGGDDLFYIDIDTMIVDSIQPLLDKVRGFRKLVMLSDFYHPEHPASGVMYVPARVKARVWAHWVKNECWFMLRRGSVGRRGDQGVIGEIIPDAHRWDDLVPGAIVSYKKHVIAPDNRYWVKDISEGNGAVPPGARIVCFHGTPRPWSV